ncbi:hypothetical protein Droror1_Dr00011171 [Drosera rotundifolia]
MMVRWLVAVAVATCGGDGGGVRPGRWHKRVWHTSSSWFVVCVLFVCGVAFELFELQPGCLDLGCCGDWWFEVGLWWPLVEFHLECDGQEISLEDDFHGRLLDLRLQQETGNLGQTLERLVFKKLARKAKEALPGVLRRAATRAVTSPWQESSARHMVQSKKVLLPGIFQQVAARLRILLSPQLLGPVEECVPAQHGERGLDVLGPNEEASVRGPKEKRVNVGQTVVDKVKPKR